MATAEKRKKSFQDNSSSDDDLTEQFKDLKKHRPAISHLYTHSSHHNFEEVDWLRFMAPDIVQARSFSATRPWRINTVYSSMGGPAAALQAPSPQDAKLAYTRPTDTAHCNNHRGPTNKQSRLKQSLLKPSTLQLLQEMKVPFIHTFSADPQSTQVREDMDRLGLVHLAAHHFRDVTDLVKGGAMCSLHREVCIPELGKVPGPSTMAGPSCTVSHRAPLLAVPPQDDLSIAGLPADAREPILHIISTFLSLLPRTFLVESAAGLAEADQLKAALDDKYHIAIIETALGLWVNVERSRPAPQLFSIEQGCAR